MKVPFFSRIKKAQSELHLSSESSSDSNASSSSSLSSSSISPPVSFRDKMSPQERKRMEKLKKSSSFSRPAKEKSGRSWGLKSLRQRSGRQSFDLTKELTETFRYFDKNGDGKISANELGQVLRSLGIESTHEELQAMVMEVDYDKDGFINLQEFITLNRLALEATEGEDGESKSMEEAFDVFDLDGDGYISAGELHKVLSGLGEVGLTVDECRTMINNVDQDGDGLVNFTEFKWLMHDSRVY